MRYWLWLCLSLCASGCMEAAAIPPAPPEPDTDPVVQHEPAESTFSAGVPQSLLETIHELVSDSGQITFEPAAPIVIVRPEASITIHPGTRITYVASDDQTTLTFNDPKPVIAAKVFGITVRPKLNTVQLFADGSGMADVGSGITHTRRKFQLDWGEDKTPAEESPATVEAKKPVVWLFVMSGCPPCVTAKRELTEARDKGELPFDFEIKEGRPHFTAGSRPVLQWHESKREPDQGPGNKYIEGWPGLKAFLKTWKENRKEATAEELAAAAGDSPQRYVRTGKEKQLPVRHYVRHTPDMRATVTPNTIAAVIDHLCEDSNHRHSGSHRFRREMFVGWSLADLLDLHSDDHADCVDWRVLASK